MRRCPTCQRAYEDALGYCLDDGAALIDAEARSVADLVGAPRPAGEVRALLDACARALEGVDRARLGGVLLPQDLELVDPARSPPRVLVAVDLELRRREDAAAVRQRAVQRAPESVRGEATDDAALVYGLGCVGYALATGRAPFAGLSPAAIQVHKLLEAPPRAETEDALAELLLRAMSLDRAARPPLAAFRETAVSGPAMDVSAMAAPAPAMAAPAPAMAAPGASKPRRSRARWWGVSIALALVFAGGASLVFVSRNKASVSSAPPLSGPLPSATPVAPPTPATARAPTPASPPPTEPSVPSAEGEPSPRGRRAPEPSSEPSPEPSSERAEPSRPVVPGAYVPAQRRDDVTPWVMIASGVLVASALAVVGARAWRRRRRASVPAVAPTWVSEPLRSVPSSGEAFAHTLPDARSGPRAVTGRRCPSCAQEVPQDARFCPFDGATLGGPTVPAHASAPRAFRVGPYECVEPLGEGGMGVVYRARHVHLGRPAAVKVLLPGAGLDAARVELFRREARLAASVQHPNSVLIYDFGELQGAMLYLAMELVEGRTLDALIDGRPMPPARVRGIALQIGDGLDAAHAAGIVHRDLKPANVMISGDGPGACVKIVDFGVARGVWDPRATEAGRVIGTLPYMAPEQARGEAGIDARADVFSFGVVAYEMLTGALPFEDHTRSFHAALLQRVMLDAPPPPVRARVPSLPAAVDTCIARALQPDRARRTPSAGAFARELAAALTGS